MNGGSVTESDMPLLDIQAAWDYYLKHDHQGRGFVLIGHIPTCSSMAQTGCVYVWGSYFADDRADRQFFGMARHDGMDSACVSPAAPGGGKGILKLYHRKAPFASRDDPPWVETVGQLSGECRANQAGVALRVTVEPGPASVYLPGLLKQPPLPAGWGLHTRDISLVQGNILDVLDAEIAALAAKH